MNYNDDLPHKIRIIENIYIPMPDGTRLAAKIWLPVDADKKPVPAILEYIPYRKRDIRAGNDHKTHAWFAGHGYACLRVDIRGTGDSEGYLENEYLKSEQDDAISIIDWTTAQSWCYGTVGMIGISWGGFNGLQVAARAPDALKAVIAMCSTDDRYADDIHYMGGCLLSDNLTWAAYMFSRMPLPPDPALAGEGWRDMWQQRLEDTTHWLEPWLEHQRRDDYWKHGSVCEDFSAIKCPVYAVGGWADAYTNTVFRLLEGLDVPRRGLIGPWGHMWPQYAGPEPSINFLQECLRWWDQHLKGIDTGIMDEPVLTTWMQDTMPPRVEYEERPGRWITEQNWPSTNNASKTLFLNNGTLDETAGSEETLSLCSLQDTGSTSGIWFPYGKGPEMPIDQRREDGGSLVFQTEPLTEAVEVLGQPVVHLRISADKPQANIGLCLSDVMPDGRATRVSYGMFNLTHRNSHETPEALEPGTFYTVRVPINVIGQRFPKGHRIRLAISTAFWPIIWPSPEAATITIQTGSSTLELPIRTINQDESAHNGFGEPECAAPLDITEIEPALNEWSVTHHMHSGEVEYLRTRNTGVSKREDISLTCGSYSTERFIIKPEDPQSATATIEYEQILERGEWSITTQTSTVMTCDATHYHVNAELDAYEGDTRVFSKNFKFSVPRDHT